MLQIRNGKQERVVENRAREFERDAMLASVRRRFNVVPLELKLTLMQNLLSRIIASFNPLGALRPGSEASSRGE